jgi:ABC-type sugar transport system ATPase subunit
VVVTLVAKTLMGAQFAPFVAGFIGSPSMNFVTGQVQGNGQVALAHGGVAAGTN